MPCVVMSWPVINPLSRYRHAKRMTALAVRNGEAHRAAPRSYWKNEDNMAEANPMLALERGENVQMPPAIWFQGAETTPTTIRSRI